MHSNLYNTPFPEGIPNPHSCGTSPFVPDVSGKIQNSCGSYKAGFNPETGCNKYKPLKPDDLWIAEHGCDNIGDCRDGKFPDSGEPYTRWMFPATGFIPEENNGLKCGSTVESFGSGSSNCLLKGLMWLVILYVALKMFCGKCR